MVLGIAVAVVLIAAQRLVVFAERRVEPEIWLGTVLLVGVLVVWTAWRLPLEAAIAMLSIAAFDFLDLRPGLGVVRAATPLVTVLVTAGLRQGTEHRVRERAVASVDAFLRAAHDREGTGTVRAGLGAGCGV